jgi:glycerophosphoryl diester phosphodiesterase
LIGLRRRDGRVIRVGHRGAAALEPENTIRSFRRAVELGVDFVELDVLDLDDGTLVVAHSDDLAEVSHGEASGRVRSLPLGELRQAAAELPTFDEALEFLATTDVGIHVDVKCRHRGDALADALRRHGLVVRSVASAFWPGTLRELAAAEPRLAVALTYPEDRRGLARRRLLAPLVPPAVRLLGRSLPRRLPRLLGAAPVQGAMLQYGVLSAAAVAASHAAGVAVWAWTVNTAEVLGEVLDAGVDGVISDDPSIFRATLPP